MTPDQLVRKLMGWDSFEELVTREGYEPSICLAQRRESWRLWTELADLYDAEQKRRGSTKHARRCCVGKR